MSPEMISFLSFTRREVSRLLRVWKQTIIPPIVTSLLYILIFGYSLGSRITNIDGVSYLEFIFPGLIMMGVISSSYSNTSSSLYISKFQRNIQEVLVAPISYLSIIAALSAGSIVRSILVASGTIIIGSLFAGLHIVNVAVILYFLLMGILLFAFAGILTGLWADSFDEMTIFSTFVVTPLTYLGGVFYSIDMLPGIWKTISLFNPIYYLVDGFRYGFFGNSSSPLWLSFLVVTSITVIFAGTCIILFRKGYKIRV